ncbi:MAG TPA: macrolide ABC transporter ATP-binding protein [Myxococcales bacterium]|nr:macrolide ABC transporter ATP-binding protein [Myxococcales bacterium]
MSDTPSSAKVVAQLQGVGRDYETDAGVVHALSDVSLEITEGEVVAIAGPSGSGKSTLLGLIGALDTATSGVIEVEGNTLSELSSTEAAALRRDRIGFIFQAYNLIPVLTAIENVEYVMLLQGKDKAARTERATEVLSAVGLGDLIHRRPNELSGGQQQRVAVARALAANPALILADEPTANLDSQTASELLDMMVELNQSFGTTFVFSTHDPMVMERASRIIRLRDGKVEAQENA